MAVVAADPEQVERSGAAGVTSAVVIYESLTGNTARAARLVADEVAAHGVEVSIFSITDIGLKELAAADVVFVGTWVDGLVLFGHRPGRAGRIRSMPVIDGKRVAAFMTYAVHAGKALERFEKVLAERGATVVAKVLLRRDRLDAGVSDLVSAALATVPA
jgi:flavorubredoxin